MERLKQALERARSEREVTVAGAPSAAIRDATAPRRVPRQTRPPVAEVKVTYTQTETITADPARLREQRILVTDDLDPAVEAYKVLRTHVLQRMRTNGWRTLAVTSPGEGNGKTLTAINLAISLAREVNQTILLVDLDLRRPSLGRYFTERPTQGLSDYLTEGAELSDILINPGIERLVILPGNHSFTQSSEMLCSPRMVQLVQELKTRYADRLTVFDMPPLLAADDVLAFSPYIDAIMLVVEDGRTTKADLARAYELLGNRNILGTVLNKSGDASAAVGYY